MNNICCNKRIFNCGPCDFTCNKIGDYNRHLITRKHIRSVNKNENITEQEIIYDCSKCLKTFKTSSGLWKHKKQCNVGTASTNNSQISDDILYQIFQQNRELMEKNTRLTDKLLELSSAPIIHSNTYHTNNLSTSTFNLNFFLNETCKDAMNISEFVNSIHPEIKDLENTGKQGYANGISQLIIKNLQDIETTKRPIHCSDLKREVLYVKNNNNWAKEIDGKPIITNAIKVISVENMKMIHKWKSENPGCTDITSKYNTNYLHIVGNSMPGNTEEESVKNINKIITNLAKEVIIEK